MNALFKNEGGARTAPTRRELTSFVRKADENTLNVLRELVEKQLEEREKKRREQEAATREKRQRCAELVSLIASEGFSLDELAAIASGAGGGKKPPKYQFEVNGVLHFWSGIGNMPHALNERISRGEPLSSFLISTS